MSFLSGLISGSLVAGGVYYAVFSRDLHTRTVAHQKDLKFLTEALREPQVDAPPPAAARIHTNPRKTLLIQRWNSEIEGLYRTVNDWENKVSEWGRRIIGDSGSQ